MNATQRAKALCLEVSVSLSGKEYKAIQHALEEQELDTRKACAEAVGEVIGETGDDLIDAGLAQAACINSRVN